MTCVRHVQARDAMAKKPTLVSWPHKSYAPLLSSPKIPILSSETHITYIRLSTRALMRKQVNSHVRSFHRERYPHTLRYIYPLSLDLPYAYMPSGIQLRYNSECEAKQDIFCPCMCVREQNKSRGKWLTISPTKHSVNLYFSTRILHIKMGSNNYSPKYCRITHNRYHP